MKWIVAVLGLLVLFALPMGAIAQYDYPPSGPTMESQPPSMGDMPPMGGGVPVMGGMPSMMGEQSDSVTIVDFAFQPRVLSVSVGSTVTWQNSGSAPHTVTSNNGAFDSGTIGSGGSFSTTLSDPGMVMYHCSIHPNMMGAVMVTGS